MSAGETTLYLLWSVVLVNLVLTVRLVGWARAAGRIAAPAETWAPELPVGEPAPTFRARLVDGSRVTEESFAGRAVAYVFLSPNCESCRSTLAQLQAFVPAARQRRTEVVVVTDTGATQTRAWLDDVQAGGAALGTPVVAAPPKISSLVPSYDGPAFFPYFVLVDAAGLVRARGIVGRPAWVELTETWAGRRAAVPAGD